MISRRLRQALVCGVIFGGVVLVAASLSLTSEEVVMTGVYTSSYQDRPASLRAVFAPRGDQEWSVVFRFTHGGARHAYSGLARGNLETGQIVGQVDADRGSRRFTFRCDFRGDRCSGTHYELMRSGEQKTGDFELEEAR